eukprot:1095626-Alexandrium_andersonii.AAC.1
MDEGREGRPSRSRAPSAQAEAAQAFPASAYSANSLRPRSARSVLLVRVAEAAGVRRPTQVAA